MGGCRACVAIDFYPHSALCFSLLAHDSRQVKEQLRDVLKVRICARTRLRVRQRCVPSELQMSLHLIEPKSAAACSSTFGLSDTSSKDLKPYLHDSNRQRIGTCETRLGSYASGPEITSWSFSRCGAAHVFTICFTSVTNAESGSHL
eukprot:6176920-Pleurochrysis_carterae.AAC.2